MKGNPTWSSTSCLGGWSPTVETILQTAEAALILGPWQALYSITIAVAAVDTILLLLCLLWVYIGRPVAAAVAVYGSLNLMCVLFTAGACWLRPNQVIWKAAETAWDLGLPYVRWLTLLSQAVVSVIAFLAMCQLISMFRNMKRTDKAFRCAIHDSAT
jgi:hypothetical protein